MTFEEFLKQDNPEITDVLRDLFSDIMDKELNPIDESAAYWPWDL